MTKSKEMIWNVYHCRVSTGEVVEYNIFDHYKFCEDVKKLMKKKLPKEEFAEALRRELSYYFWAKCEWEVLVTRFPGYIEQEQINKLMDEWDKCRRDNGHYPYASHVEIKGSKKVDIYSQVRLNWQAFVDYVWGKI